MASRLTRSGSTPDGAADIWWQAARRAVRTRADLPLLFLDVFAVAAVYALLLLLRFDGDVPRERWQEFRRFLPFVASTHLAFNWTFGLYGRLWRHAGVQEARRVVAAGAFGAAAVGWLVLLSHRPIPLTVALAGGPCAAAVIGLSRFQSRLFAFARRNESLPRTRVAVVGAGEAGAYLLREMMGNPARGLEPVAVFDDDPRTNGRRLLGVPVVGPVSRLAATAAEIGIEQVVLAVATRDADLARRVADQADRVELPVRVLPSVHELIGGHPTLGDVRELRLKDLIGRHPVSIDLEAVRRLVAGRRVLVTGGGGSIGSEIARQVTELGPSALVLVDNDETHLHDAMGELDAGATCAVPVLVDVRDGARLRAVFTEHRPEIVFHAAAHKHVPILEAHPAEAVLTNVVGTANVVDAGRAAGVETMVFISTDKAVRPSSVMGASKRIGERLVLGGAPDGTRWCAVRFGNVIGSRGSVIPTFVRQIEQGGPVTVTDPEMTRFFMSVHEAVRLVLQSAALAAGGEVFMLDMGEPVRIVDLARRMIRLAGRRPGHDIEIRVTGARPGEKLHEELVATDEVTRATDHRSIVSVTPARVSLTTLLQQVAALCRLSEHGEPEAVRAAVLALADPAGATAVIDVADVELATA